MSNSTLISCLIPPDAVIAAVERFRDTLCCRGSCLPGIGLTPVIPLKRHSQLFPPLPAQRITAPVEFGLPLLKDGYLFLSVSDPATLSLMAACLPQDTEADTHTGLFPLSRDLFIARWPQESPPPPSKEITAGLRSASFTLALIEYRFDHQCDGWWDLIEEIRHWEQPVRKPSRS